MKTIRIEISVEHVMDEADDVGDTIVESGVPDESTTMALTKCIDDNESTAAAVEQLNAELMRRFKFINARRTN
jgi:hypothetical protein